MKKKNAHFLLALSEVQTNEILFGFPGHEFMSQETKQQDDQWHAKIDGKTIQHLTDVMVPPASLRDL